MIRGEVEFLADTMLLQKVATIQYGLHKTAGFGDTLKGMLGDGLSSISSAVSASLADTLTGGDVISKVGSMIVNGGLFSLWWPLGVINSLGGVFGFDAQSIASKIWSMLRGPLNSKGQVTQQEVSSAVQTVTSSIAGSPDSSDARTGRKHAKYDLLEPIRTAEKNGQLYHFVKYSLGASFDKMAAPQQTDFWGRPVRSNLSSSGKSAMLGWLSRLPLFKTFSIVGGLVGWAIKAALLGAGLMVASGSLMRLVGLKKDEPATSTDSETPSENPEGAAHVSHEPEAVEEESSGQLTATGRGQDVHPNDHVKSQWIVPMVGGSLPSTLIAWSRDVYKEMEYVDDDTIKSLPSFNKIVSEISRFLEAGSRKITVPPRYKTRKQVVDQFARDAAKHIDGENQ